MPPKWPTRPSRAFTHILNLSSFDNTKLAKLHGIRILWNYVSDDLMPKSPEVFRRGVKFAKPALAKKENKLLIHCAAGSWGFGGTSFLGED